MEHSARHRLSWSAVIAGALISLSTGISAQSPSREIRYPSEAGTPLVRAVEKLAEDLGWERPRGVATSSPVPGVIVVTDRGQALILGPQGYSITGGGAWSVVVTGATEKGTVNGVHGLRRRLRMTGTTGRITARFNETVVPSFARRGVMVSPAGYGGQENRIVFGPDSWGIDQWKEYIDYLRLLNASHLQFFPLRMWHPDYPSTFLEKARYEVWREAMHYCQEVGIEFQYCMLPNQVPAPFFWENREQSVQGNGTFFGTALSPHGLQPGRPELIYAQQPTYDYFKDADAFIMIWNDGGAADYSPDTLSDPVGVLTDMLTHVEARIRAAGSDARFLFWAWLLEPWYYLFAPEHFVTYPQLATFAADARIAVRNLPFDVEWMQESDRVYSYFNMPPHILEPYGAARAAGFEEITGFMYLTHLEVPDDILPRPLISEVQSEVQGALAHGVNGMTAYRLAPAGRFLNDWVALRLAEDASLSRSDLIDEMAAYLCRGDAAFIGATTVALDHLDRGRPINGLFENHIFDAALALAPLDGLPIPPDLDRLDTLVTFMTYAVLSKSSLVSPSENAAFFKQCLSYARTKRLLQSFSSQPLYGVDARIKLRDFLDRMPW